MSIQKKSLISALKTTKKANVASAPVADVSGKSMTSMKKNSLSLKQSAISAKNVGSLKTVRAKNLTSLKTVRAKNLASYKSVSAKRMVE